MKSTQQELPTMGKHKLCQITQWSTTQRKKSNGILKFAGKWMSLEETILSEVTQSQKGKHGKYSHISGFKTQSKEDQPTIHTANETNNHGGP